MCRGGVEGQSECHVLRPYLNPRAISPTIGCNPNEMVSCSPLSMVLTCRSCTTVSGQAFEELWSSLAWKPTIPWSRPFSCFSSLIAFLACGREPQRSDRVVEKNNGWQCSPLERPLYAWLCIYPSAFPTPMSQQSIVTYFQSFKNNNRYCHSYRPRNGLCFFTILDRSLLRPVAAA
jgi:hypothetical protein